MAVDYQLIPRYRHPSETTFIFDHTVVQDTEFVNQEAVSMLCVFAGPKGRDNQLIRKMSLYSHVEEFGKPNYALYGQPGYIPYTALSTGNAYVWDMRVMPNDATYANIIYAIKFKRNPDNGKMMIKAVPYAQEDLYDRALFPTFMDSLRNMTEDEEGFLTLPYIGICNLGRGDYGKYYRVRLGRDVDSNKENTMMNYTLQLLSTEDGGIMEKETFPALNLTEDAVDPKTGVTTYISDVVNDIEGDGSFRIAVEFKADNHIALYNWYKKWIDPDTELTPETFDVFGYDRNNTETYTNDKIEVVDGYNSIALCTYTGIQLRFGSDGSLGTDVAPAVREDTMENLYQTAFSGGLDPKINSKLRTPCNVWLDANFSLSVKKLAIAWVLQREDMLGYVDSGLLKTINQCKNFAKQLVDIDTYYISKNMGMLTTRDAITGKKIPVSITQWLAYKIPMHWRQNGCYTAMAAEDYAQVSGYVPHSIYPEIDADNHDVKEWFYDARWNYIECIGEDTYIRGTQQTSQLALSDLSEENNIHVLLLVKKRLERLCAQKRYHLGEESDRKIYTEDARELFSSWEGTYLRSIDIRFTMNRYEELRSILHCTCEIVFNTLIKRSVIEININPRA